MSNEKVLKPSFDYTNRVKKPHEFNRPKIDKAERRFINKSNYVSKKVIIINLTFCAILSFIFPTDGKKEEGIHQEQAGCHSGAETK